MSGLAQIERVSLLMGYCELLDGGLGYWGGGAQGLGAGGEAATWGLGLVDPWVRSSSPDRTGAPRSPRVLRVMVASDTSTQVSRSAGPG